MHPSGVYEIKNLVNGKRYIGSAVDFGNRFRQHAQSLKRGDHHSIALQRAWVMYGPFAFQFNKLLVCSKENLIMYEQAAMDAMKPEYNCAPRAGSRLGMKASDELRAKLSASRPKDFSPMKGKKHTEATKAKISASRKGKGGGPMGEERKKRISEAHKGRVIDAEMRARISATLTGRKQSQETIAKRVEKLKGRKMPDGFAEKTRQRMLGSKRSAESILKSRMAKARLSDNQVREIRLLLKSGGISQRKIAKLYSIDRSAISEIKCGKTYDWVED